MTVAGIVPPPAAQASNTVTQASSTSYAHLKLTFTQRLNVPNERSRLVCVHSLVQPCVYVYMYIQVLLTLDVGATLM